MDSRQREVAAIAKVAVQSEVSEMGGDLAAKAANSEVTPESPFERRRGIRLTAERAIFLEWLALTDVERRERGMCSSQRELSRQICVSESTLSHWRSEPDFQRDLSRRLRGICQEAAPAIIKRQAKKATDEGDTPAARLVLDHAMPDEKPNVAVAVQIGMSNEELVGSADADANLPEWVKLEQAAGEGTAPDV